MELHNIRFYRIFSIYVDKRAILSQRLQRSARTRPVVVLTGARQTGKTSTFRRLFPNHMFVSWTSPLKPNRPKESRTASFNAIRRQ